MTCLVTLYKSHTPITMHVDAKTAAGLLARIEVLRASCNRLSVDLDGLSETVVSRLGDLLDAAH